MSYSLFISCPRNMEYLLNDELQALGLTITKISPRGIYGDADLTTIYQICLWSRLANRVQLILFKQKISDNKQLYQCCKHYPWSNLFSVDKTLAIDFHGSSSFIKNTMYGAQVIKDAIVDYFREQQQQRPSVNKNDPDIRLHAHLKQHRLTLSLDLVGYSLHQRGYRKRAGAAPIKENVAAALLIRAQWPQLAEKGYHLYDPFCGSATLLIEAALMASNTAPGLLRHDQALRHWHGHDPVLWEKLKAQAAEQRKAITNNIVGFDSDAKIIAIAKHNIAMAHMQDHIQVKQQTIEQFNPEPAPALLITNPPYGERLADSLQLVPVYQQLGQQLFQHGQGWQAAILTANANLAKAIGLRFDKQYTFYNGPLETQLYCYSIDASNQLKENVSKPLSDGAQALFNRLMKNKKHLSKWLKRQNITCYRLYDAELPEYAFAIDIYNDWVHAQEYTAPKSIPIEKAEKRSLEMLQVLPQVLAIPREKIVLKQRQQQKGKQQYQALAKKKQQLVVTEGPARFIINLQDYLDTGLFLDHRLLRLKFSEKIQGKRLLNCFCYTASISVHAALAGSKTVNVDLSNTYLTWAKQNFTVNKIPLAQHQFIQADCLQWLRQCKDKFDVIFLDPPSFSNSKRMQGTLDVQRDHEQLIDDAMRCLTADGVLYFSNNFKRFKLADSVKQKYVVSDITKQTIDEDFKHSPHIHHCYLLRHER